MSAATDALKGKKDDSYIWVENMLNGDSVYRSDTTKDKYTMTPSGYEGSIISVPVKVAKEAFFRRALSRGKIKLLTDSEASRREDELEEMADHEHDEIERISKSLEEGASEVGARYTKKGLSDDAHERSSISSREALGETTKTARPTTVRRAVPKDEALVIEPVITERVKQGDWDSDTGE